MMTSSLPIDKKKPLEAWPAFMAGCKCLNHWCWGFGKHFWAFYVMEKVKRRCKKKNIPYTVKYFLKNGELQLILHCKEDPIPNKTDMDEITEDIDMGQFKCEDITCGGCRHIKRGKPAYCEKYGYNLSGTLERLEVCKTEDGKELAEDQE